MPLTEGTAEDPLLERLLHGLGPDKVLFDESSWHTCAIDASPCYFPPKAIVLPRVAADVVRTVNICRDLAAPVTPRAAGTSLSGAAIGPGVDLGSSPWWQTWAALDSRTPQ